MADKSEKNEQETSQELISETTSSLASEPSKKRPREEDEDTEQSSEKLESKDAKTELVDTKPDTAEETDAPPSKRQKSISAHSSRENTAELIAEVSKNITPGDDGEAVDIKGLPDELPDSEEDDTEPKKEEESEPTKEAAETEKKDITTEETKEETSEATEPAESKKSEASEKDSEPLSKSKEESKTAETETAKSDKNSASSFVSSTTTFKGGFGSFASSSFGTPVKPSTASTNSPFAGTPTTDKPFSSAISTPQTGSVFLSGPGNGKSIFANNGFANSGSAFSTPNAKPGAVKSFWEKSSESSDEKSAEETESASDKKETTESSTANPSADGEQPKDLYAQVAKPLTQQVVQTGEEHEISVFNCRAKLYVLEISDSGSAWKERGIGTLHVNTVKEEAKPDFKGAFDSRIVMRADGVLKVILNVPLYKTVEVMEGMKSSLSSEKFVRISCFEEGKPIQYSLRTSNAETAKKLYENIKKLIPNAS